MPEFMYKLTLPYNINLKIYYPNVHHFQKKYRKKIQLNSVSFVRNTF